MHAERTAASQIREAADKVAQAKSLAAEVLEGWDRLPDDLAVESEDLERAIELLGIAERALDDDADEIEGTGGRGT